MANHLFHKARALALALFATASLHAQAAPGVRAPSTPLQVGDTAVFTVYDNQFGDAVDPDLGMELIDFSFAYEAGTLQYLSASSLVGDAFFTAPDLAVDADPQGSFLANWVRFTDGATPVDLFTVSFKVLSLPANALSSLSLSLPAGGSYGTTGAYADAAASVTVVPEPAGVAMLLAGLGVLLGSRLGRRRTG